MGVAVIMAQITHLTRQENNHDYYYIRFEVSYWFKILD